MSKFDEAIEKYKVSTQKVSVNRLCNLLGLSKQAYYKRHQSGEQDQLETQIV